MAEGKGQENPTKREMGSGGGAKTGARGPTPSNMPMKTASWPGLPGGTGPERSGGINKKGHFGGAKFDYAKSEGC